LVVTRALDCVAPLFVPGHRPDRFAKAAASGADAVIIDLEDAVPADAKEAARANIRADLDAPVIVRVNGPGTPWWDGDLAAVASLPLAGIMVPKAATGVPEALSGRGITVPVLALIETARPRRREAPRGDAAGRPPRVRVRGLLRRTRACP
jgi:citrate lyase subunit beta/citryl-CoA lyase